MANWHVQRLEELLPILAAHGVTRFALGELVIERGPAPAHVLTPGEAPAPADGPKDATDLALDGAPPPPGDDA